MAMMMTGRVLLVCALCVLWCGAACFCEDLAPAVEIKEGALEDSQLGFQGSKGEQPESQENVGRGSKTAKRDDGGDEDSVAEEGGGNDSALENHLSVNSLGVPRNGVSEEEGPKLSSFLPVDSNISSTGGDNLDGGSRLSPVVSGVPAESTEGRREKTDVAAGSRVTGEITQQTKLELTPGGGFEPRDVSGPDKSGSQEVGGTPEQSSKRREAFVGTQQQDTELRPLSQDGKPSGDTNEIPPGPGDIRTQPDTTQATIAGVQDKILQSSPSLRGAVTVNNQSGQHPETTPSNTQQDDGATPEDRSQSEETGDTRRKAHEGSELAIAIVKAKNGVTTPCESDSSPAATSSVRCIVRTESNLTTIASSPPFTEDAARLNKTHNTKDSSKSTMNAVSQVAGSETPQNATAKTDDKAKPGDSDSSTAVSHTTSPLLLLLVVACAAAVVAS
ncbi:mucin-associated surface protein (MASP), putative [Trypanosoma cruzi marinkellei]|uniref:Mucin-associated surface protein (MASP), putative n=1 Tax=Trypanosoma cruzi marinkellei TaxID=85056 RepID=K2NPI6_TRYCR|nr:mucin-associated surface protein (MASP), putative [Trypanosoma cruzi marinkellei]